MLENISPYNLDIAPEVKWIVLPDLSQKVEPL